MRWDVSLRFYALGLVRFYALGLGEVIVKEDRFESPVDSEEGDSIGRDLRQLMDRIIGFESPVDT